MFWVFPPIRFYSKSHNPATAGETRGLTIIYAKLR